jgi:protein-tyrosine phosphatase
MESLIPIHIYDRSVFNKASTTEEEEVQLPHIHNAVFFDYDSVFSPNFTFIPEELASGLSDQSSIQTDNDLKMKLFPFLLKSLTLNQKKILRQYLFVFHLPTSATLSEIDLTGLKTKVISIFLQSLQILKAKIVGNDFYSTEESEESLATPFLSTSEGDETFANISFTTKVLVLEDNFERFHLKYQLCHSLFKFSALDTARNILKDTVPLGRPKWAKASYYASEILENFLFLGDYMNGSEAEQLKALAITHLVDLTGHQTSARACQEVGVSYLPVDIWDMETTNIAEHFDMTNSFISRAEHIPGSRVLVHCRAGWSRSTSIVLAYLVGCKALTLADAVKLTVQERPMICPNEGFREQLIQYEERIIKEELSGKERSFSDATAFLNFIRKYSILWVTDVDGKGTGTATIETDFDRIPIQALKNNNKVFEELMNQSAVSAEEGSSQQRAKPKKPFLKRGEGKTILGAKLTKKTEPSPIVENADS